MTGATATATFDTVTKIEAIRAACALGLTKYEMLVLTFVISLMNGKSGLAWPSRKTIAMSCAMKEPSVRKSIRALEAKGLLVVAEPSTPRRSARYAVDLAKICADSEARIASSAGAAERSQPERHGALRGSSGGRKGGAPRLPEEELRMIEAEAKIRLNSSDGSSPSLRRPMGRLAAAKPSSREQSYGTNLWAYRYAKN